MLVQNWVETSPWVTVDGNTTSASFPVAQLGLGNGIYQFQATATNAVGVTPFNPNGVEATMIVDLGDTIKPQEYMPIISR